MTLSSEHAAAFAKAWFAAWNAHDITAILSCYHPTIEHSSPFIKRYNDAIGRGNEKSLRGLADLRDYFQRALDRNPTLRFDPVSIATGLESVILVYRRHSHDTPPAGELSAEVFFLVDTPAGHLITRSVSHYG